MLLMYVLISDWSVQGVQFESSTQALVRGGVGWGGGSNEDEGGVLPGRLR